MRNFISIKQRYSGFTLIELLIVIALVGIVAIISLALLDPLEQINRGSDSGIEANATELLQAFNRYLVSNDHYPWYSVGSGNLSTNTAEYYNTYPSSPLISYMNNLVSSGEMRANFLTNAKLDKLYLTAGFDDAPLFVCFQPKSKSFRGSTSAIYTVSGAVQSGCPDPNSNLCHRCYN